MRRVLIIDNYDSFTYNLVQALAVLQPQPELIVRRNDAVTLAELETLGPTHLVVSPGPCTPNEAGMSNALIRAAAGRTPLLGVCLGHQCIGAVFGGRVIPARRCMHGKTSVIRHDGRGVLAGLDDPFTAMRYHSLAVDPAGMDDGFVVSAWTEHGEVMGLRHEQLRIEGVQFHPESFATPAGGAILDNFLKTAC